MTYKYKYNGTAQVHVPSIGKLVNPGDTIDTDIEVNHPDFELVEKEVKPKKA